MDRAKTGTKRSLLVEATGVPISLAMAGANTNDSKLLAATIESIPVERPVPTPEKPQPLCLEEGYDYEEARQAAEVAGFIAHARSRSEEVSETQVRKPGQKARRWVVERTHFWFHRFRSILTRWSKNPRTTKACSTLFAA